MTEHDLMARIKARTWFYEFDLPDGSKTRTDLSDAVRPIHATRLAKLREVLAAEVDDASSLTAIDLASHEGYFTFELARHFHEAIGIDLRSESLDAARDIAALLKVGNARFLRADLQASSASDLPVGDFVLLFGLLYHLENPVHAMRLAAALSRRHILVETQVLPYEIDARVEDGHYLWQRPVLGHFGVVRDYPNRREGGATPFALVPSRGALLGLLRDFGFETLRVLDATPHDYEQFGRGSRLLVYGRKP